MRAPRLGRLAREKPRRGLRGSLATRLLLGGLVFTIALIGCVSALLLLSRSQQTQASAQTNADNRAQVADQLVTRVVGAQASFAATDLTAIGSLQSALAGSDPATAVSAEFADGNVVILPGLDVAVLDMHGTVLYTSECDHTSGGHTIHPPTAACETSSTPHVTAALQSVQDALAVARTRACQAPSTTVVTNTAVSTPCPATSEGTELLGGLPAIDVAAPVFNAVAGTYAPLGVVVYSSPLQTQLARLGPVIGFTPDFVDASGTRVVRFAGTSYTPTPALLPTSLLTQLRSHTTTNSADGFEARALYNAPEVGDVAGSFVPLAAPGGSHVVGFLGVEVPLSLFAASTAQDETNLAIIGLAAIGILCVLVTLFIDHFVRRPVARLERGVARIAAGDYSTAIPVKGPEELARLAGSVNRMREEIAGYVDHVDGSISRLQEVSHALTTTTGGVKRLQDAVLHAAAADAGDGAVATLYKREGDRLVPARVQGAATLREMAGTTASALLEGRSVRLDSLDRHELAVPMSFQGVVTGALMLTTSVRVTESDERALVTLANNAAVALENTRMFEQEKETVQRLRDLNQLKTDLLGSAQHELRTPVLAIQGQLDLLTRAWEKWDETNRLEVVRDIEISTRLLGEMVDTIVDFSLLSSDTLELHARPTDVRETAQAAADDIRAHFKDGLPVRLTIDVPADAIVDADAARLRRVLRALLDNAVKFTQPGGHVEITAHADAALGLCRIDVADDGIGISAEALPRIFDRFSQADTSRTRRYGGMGLGLALVRRLCEVHRATVRVESSPGRGTRFILHWPLATRPVRAGAEHLEDAAVS
jgi:signal transduction histidine kinase/HAMP domain-containing protein